MTCCNSSNKVISVYKGFGTKWNGENLLNVSFDTQISLEDFKAEFRIGDIVKIYDDIKDGFAINLTAQETATLQVGPNTGTFILIDMENNKRPFTTELPFLVKDWEDGDVELDGFKISVDAKVQENILNIRIETESADAAVEEKIRYYIALHNESEQAHPYIQGLISAEEEARISADETLQGNIEAEQSRAEGIEDALDDKIDNEIERATDKEGELATAIEDEETRAKGVEEELSQAIETTAGSIKNGVLTIQKNGTAVQTFSANQSSNVTANLIIPTKTSDITNDSDFATNSGVATAVSNHNTSESAHSYIQGLITAEETRAEGVEGTLSNLTTDSKTNLVSAINEVDAHTDTNTSNIGNLSNLTTSEKSTLVGAINEVDSMAETALQPSDVIDALDSTETQKPLSANMGKELQDEIDNLKARGRFLALWNCATGLAESDPPTGTYTYQSGDYFIVGVVASGSGTNYKPNGSSYTTDVASTTVETEVVDVDDVYYYDGNVWRLQINTQKTISFVNIAGDPYDNSNLAAAFNEKQNTITGGASTITSSNLTENRALVSNGQGKVAVSGVTSTELGYVSGVTSAIQTQLNGKADTSLSNLTSTGKNIGNWSTNVSNCITEIPQDIKLELNNGTLTLKSGSVLTAPDGTQWTTTSDITNTNPGNGKRCAFVRKDTGSFSFYGIDNVVSGATDSKAGQVYHIWFDTTNNEIKGYTTDASNPAYNTYLPVGIVTYNNGDYSIDQVFNGAGYIGHHAFVLPGIKGLVQNGLNNDGSLKSANSSNSSLRIQELANYDGGIYNPAVAVGTNGATDRWRGYYEVETREDVQTKIQSISNYTSIRFYIKEENRIIVYNGTSWVIVGYMPIAFYNYNGTSVTQFDIRQPVRLATTEMTDNLQSQIDTKADRSLSNLDSTGQMVVDSQNGTISNCITEIPQDIKLELSNGVLTLKAGSILTKPDGTQSQTTADHSNMTMTGATGKWMVFVGPNGGMQGWTPVSKIGSGSTLPADGSTYSYFLNTTDLKIYAWSNGQSSWVNSNWCLPIAVCTVNNGSITSIDQVFNGAGYIGHHAFVLPGVKGLGANGFNSDGTLNSFAWAVNELSIIDISAGNYLLWQRNSNSMGKTTTVTEVETYKDIPQPFVAWQRWYVRDENKWYVLVNTVENFTQTVFVEYRYNNGSVTKFDVRQPVRIATTEITDSLQTDISSLDSNVVKLTGNQTIDGSKTFTSSILVKSSTDTYTGYSAGYIELIPPTSATWGGFIDFHNAGSSSDYTSRIIESSSGSLYYEGSGALSDTNSTSSQVLATKGWVNNPSYSTNVVHRTGDETIGGTKTFSNSVNFNSTVTFQQSSINQYNKATGYTKGTAPTGDTYLMHRYYVDSANTAVMDEYYYIPRNTNSPSYILRFRDCSSASATSYKDIISASFDGTNGRYNIASGVITSAPTPTEDTTASTQIDTVGARNTKLGSYQLKATYDSTNEMLVLA